MPIIDPFVYPSIHPSIRPTIDQYNLLLHPSILLSIHFLLHPSVRPSIHRSIHPPIHSNNVLITLQLLQNANFLWRLAKATYFVSQLEGNSNNKFKQKHLVYKSKDFAGKALQLESDNPDAHKW